MIAIKELTKIHTTEEVETTVLDNLDLEVKEGEFVAVMGPSGCGKSTLLNILGMLDSATSGTFKFLNQDIQQQSSRERAAVRKENIGFVFQSFNLIDNLTVFQNVELPLVYQGVKKSERIKLVDELLEKMGIMHRRNHLPLQLSGGQQQRVAVARAVVSKPKLILADEPTGNLDSSSSDDALDILRKLNNEGTTIVMVTHSDYDAGFASRVIRLADGKVVDQAA
ncbi:phosphonate ABC transporter ATP-binding protein [Pseudoalteromonas luteoviolacea]|uniref:Phosphonate ABC transporter ATP-binding protein n=1 Tax=Pseudoalteromonas luteoviolacea TaxID=43657 RepID=A0A1C0TQ13_9GAMM|nr:ABC transporter ATP-binding protein [Pseudoalteromonas luteoviolacea]OCQ21022.1 phosphonate ABC transporter ATP-binding protein [Pseudoalteromonas luteoviolacea]